MKLIKEIIIKDPPIKYIKRKKRKIDPKTGKLKEDVFYLTANIFYSSSNYFIRSEITNMAKDYLLFFLKDIPKLSKMKLHFIYSRQTDNFDLDNKAYFWVKMIMDLFKEPSTRQINNAHKKGKTIKTINILKDDSVKYLDEINMKYEKGEHKMIIKIYGKEIE